MSFRREKFIPKGGPDGGDGGRGGDVVLIGDDALDTLLSIAHKPHYRARNGEPGKGSSMTGADADDLVIPVPLGTIVFDEESGDVIADVESSGQRIVVAAGGTGGRGNEHFKSATNQTPRQWTPGEETEEFSLRLELKLIADIGLIGLPNAGKSTLLRAMTAATPKVADYPFTTLNPHLGIATLKGDRRIVMADIPGLIEGAADGAGLGHYFLRHVERTHVLVHVVDLMPMDGSDPAANYATIRRELGEYDATLASKPEIIALNKVDLLTDQEVERAVRSLEDSGVPITDALCVSGATGEGTSDLLERCWLKVGGETPPGWSEAE